MICILCKDHLLLEDVETLISTDFAVCISCSETFNQLRFVDVKKLVLFFENIEDFFVRKEHITSIVDWQHNT